ncbi:hypothetical protein AIZ23_24265 [Salmonella enterica subsp. enterica serovar Typhimurium]|nr:hypothetical protein AIZ23_24265 [Salmonella enterica subsp. enterica serovar Typhimurium]
MGTTLSEVLLFKLIRTDTATRTVTTPPIEITLTINKHCCPHYFPADKDISQDTFHTQRKEAAFSKAILVTTTSRAHKSPHIIA